MLFATPQFVNATGTERVMEAGPFMNKPVFKGSAAADKMEVYDFTIQLHRGHLPGDAEAEVNKFITTLYLPAVVAELRAFKDFESITVHSGGRGNVTHAQYTFPGYTIPTMAIRILRALEDGTNSYQYSWKEMANMAESITSQLKAHLITLAKKLNSDSLPPVQKKYSDTILESQRLQGEWHKHVAATTK